MINQYTVIGGLAVVMALVMFLPFSLRKVEEELEAFLFVMGVCAATISGVWSWHLVREALAEPLMISVTVLLAGFLFRALRGKIAAAVGWLTGRIGLRALAFLVVLGLGLVSSVITAIVAALVLCEVIGVLRLERKYELKLVVCACYAIGLGAVLTPVGEPLSAIAVSKLKGPPHNADFYFLFRLLGAWVIPGVLALSALAASYKPGLKEEKETLSSDREETNGVIVVRALKVYLFVMALVLLGSGLAPLAEMTVSRVPDDALYWLNSLSAVLDNATLAAAELLPSLSPHKVKFLLMGLLVAGGMLVPGNIPNIISSAKLGIRSREWAVAAVPLGIALMGIYFVLMRFLA